MACPPIWIRSCPSIYEIYLLILFTNVKMPIRYWALPFTHTRGLVKLNHFASADAAQRTAIFFCPFRLRNSFACSIHNTHIWARCGRSWALILKCTIFAVKPSHCCSLVAACGEATNRESFVSTAQFMLYMQRKLSI